MGKHLSNELKQGIQDMNKRGIKPREISKTKMIPLSTIY